MGLRETYTIRTVKKTFVLDDPANPKAIVEIFKLIEDGWKLEGINFIASRIEYDGVEFPEAVPGELRPRQKRRA